MEWRVETADATHPHGRPRGIPPGDHSVSDTFRRRRTAPRGYWFPSAAERCLTPNGRRPTERAEDCRSPPEGPDPGRGRAPHDLRGAAPPLLRLQRLPRARLGPAPRRGARRGGPGGGGRCRGGAAPGREPALPRRAGAGGRRVQGGGGGAAVRVRFPRQRDPPAGAGRGGGSRRVRPPQPRFHRGRLPPLPRRRGRHAPPGRGGGPRRPRARRLPAAGPRHRGAFLHGGACRPPRRTRRGGP